MTRQSTDETDHEGAPLRNAGVECGNCGSQQRLPDSNRCAECGQYAPDPRYGFSELTETWYRVTEWEDLGDGRIRAKSKTEVSRDDVPDEWIAAIEKQRNQRGQG